ncbi:MAG: FG-GAP-like repeat-containing protein, partial [Mucilaginibacter sp.]
VMPNYNGNAISVYRNINASQGSLTAASLAPKVDFGVQNAPYDVFVEDLDGDGKPDIISYNGYVNGVNVLKNTSTPGNLSFAANIQFAGSSSTAGITVADINGDGKPDIITTNATNNTFSVLINTSTASAISFAPKIDFAAGGKPNSIIVADFDGDGKPDLVFEGQATTGLAMISIFKNTSSGTDISFGSQINFSVSASIVVGDIDGDGKPDIVVSDYANLAVLQNISTVGSISFKRLDFTDQAGSRSFGFLGDADGDGKLDIIESNGFSTFIVKNTSVAGSFSFAPAAVYNIKPAVAFADLDGDGKPDIVAVNYSTSPVLGIVRNRINEPAVNLISPEIGLAGTPITITGLNFLGASAVDIGGVHATSFTVNSSISITAVLGTGATGPVAVKTIYGIGTGTNFVYGTPPPVINSFSPLLGPVGTTVTISGKNFNTTAANNIVFVGVARATVTSATATQLVVKVPVGANHQPITVTANGFTAASPKTFDVTFSGAGPFAANSFSKRVDFPVPSNPFEVLVADLDGDGKTDIIDYNSSTFSIFRNTSTVGNTSFSINQDITPGGSISRAFIADIDGDGKPDLIYVSVNDKKLVILKNTSVAGTFSFAAPLIVTDRADPNGIAVADFDNDGKLDIAVSHDVNNTFSVFRNTTTSGSISFASAVVITSVTPDALGGIFSGDLDGDGKVDLVTTGQISANQALITFKNTSTIGNISFSWVKVYSSGYHPSNVIIADIDGDGKPDMAAPVGPGDFYVYKNTTAAGGKIDFADPVGYQSGTYPIGISIGDLDGDGQPDMVVPDGSFPGFIGVYRNMSAPGTLQLAAKVDYTKGASNSGVTGVGYGGTAIADFDGDGRPDMVVSNYQGATISISTNTTNAPVISAFTPASAITGATVTITGVNLDGATKVSFGGVDAASFTVNSPTSITAVVGQGSSGNISVTTPVATGIFAGFTFLPAPTLASFTPLAAGPGKTVTLKGTNFTGTTSVTFGGVNSKSFTVVSDTSITAVVDTTAASGSIAVTVPGGTVSLGGYVFTLNPTIASFTPSSGPVGSSVVISGVNFNANITGNIVYFGAAKAVITAATTHQLTVTVPVGATYQPISVLNTASGLTGYAANSFITTFNTKYSLAPSDFDPTVDFTLSNGSKASAISDIDGDGKPDVIVVNSLSNTVSIFRNTAVSGSIGLNSLAAKIDLATGNTPQGITIADIDGDGKPDIAIANLAENSVSVFLNKSTSGKISFAAPITLAS